MTLALRIARRLLAAIVTVFAIVSISWFVASVLPGDPARLLTGPQASEQDVAAVRHAQGLDRPLVVQYWAFLGHLAHTGPHAPKTTDREHRSCAEVLPHVHLDLGFSYVYQAPVVALIAKRAPVSIELGLAALLFQLVVGTAVGLWSAARRGSRGDLFAVGMMVLFATAPTFVVGLLLQYALSHRLGLLPLDGQGKDAAEKARALVLPTLTLGLYGAALFARVVREELAGSLGADYTRTARAKGAGRVRVLLIHALRPILTPIATLVALDLGALVGGAVVVEKLFRFPGMGDMAVTAVQNRDAAAVTGAVLVSSVAIVCATALADFAGYALDPRARRR